MNFLLFLIHLLVIAGITYRLAYYHSDPFGRRHLIITLVAKCLAGVGLGLIYMNYYHSGDTLMYDQEAASLSRLARNDLPVYVRFLFSSDLPPYESLFLAQPRALFLSKIVSFFYLLTGDNLWITSVYMSMLAWWGSWKLAAAFYELYPETRYAVLFSFLYFPSVIFWGSGLTKESIAIWSFGLLLAHFIRFYRDRKPYHLLYVIASFMILWQIKYYYAAVLLIALIPIIACIIYHSFPGHSKKNLVISTLLASAIAIFIVLTHPNFEPARFADVIVENYHAFIQKSAPGKYVIFNKLDGSWTGILLSIPKGISVTLTRPFIWEAWNSLSFFAGFENMFLMLLFITSLAGWQRWINVSRTRKIWLFCGLFYCLVMAAFLALSTPNMGTLYRYRIGMLPLWIYLITWANPVFKKTMNKIVHLPKNKE